jgi:hypothetical protein
MPVFGRPDTACITPPRDTQHDDRGNGQDANREEQPRTHSAHTLLPLALEAFRFSALFAVISL